VIARRSMLTVAAGFAALAIPPSVQADTMKLQLTVNDNATTATLIGNLSKSGASLSLGRRGAHVTVGHGQVRNTVGMPVTGLSYTSTRSLKGNSAKKSTKKDHYSVAGGLWELRHLFYFGPPWSEG
jgi:hypothetical protein